MGLKHVLLILACGWQLSLLERYHYKSEVTVFLSLQAVCAYTCGLYNNTNALNLNSQIFQCMHVSIPPAPACVCSFPPVTSVRKYNFSCYISATLEQQPILSISAPSGLTDSSFILLLILRGLPTFQEINVFSLPFSNCLFKYVYLGIKYCYLLNPPLCFLHLIEGVCVGG